jgi:hypothetical protein
LRETPKPAAGMTGLRFRRQIGKLDVGAGVAVDFHANADLDDARSGPAHANPLELMFKRSAPIVRRCQFANMAAFARIY